MRALLCAVCVCLCSCSPLVVRYDSEDARQQVEEARTAEKKAMASAAQSKKDAERFREEYRRLWETWNECEALTDELLQTLAECK